MARKKTESRTDELVEAITAEIRHRQLTDGDFLGTEADLSARFMISRTIVREAVGRLRALGLLISRQRKGLVIGPGTPVASFSSILPFYGGVGAENRRHLGELRQALEIGAIGLVVENALPEDIDRLKSLADAFAIAVERGDSVRCIAQDAAFHVLLLEMTHNPLIAGMHGMLARYFNTLEGKTAPMDTLAFSAWQHHTIVDAIRLRDGGLARTTLRHHLEPLVHSDSKEAVIADVISSDEG